jgi:hypothetical protein
MTTVTLPPLKKEDVLLAFGSTKAVALACRITDAAVSQWPEVIKEPRASHLRALAKAQGIALDSAKN